MGEKIWLQNCAVAGRGGGEAVYNFPQLHEKTVFGPMALKLESQAILE